MLLVSIAPMVGDGKYFSVSPKIVADLRRLRALTQEELAVRSELKAANIRRIEQSASNVQVYLSTARKLAASLGVEMADLAGAGVELRIGKGSTGAARLTLPPRKEGSKLQDLIENIATMSRDDLDQLQTAARERGRVLAKESNRKSQA